MTNLVQAKVHIMQLSLSGGMVNLYCSCAPLSLFFVVVVENREGPSAITTFEDTI